MTTPPDATRPEVEAVMKAVRIWISAITAIPMARDTDEATEYRMEAARAEIDFKAALSTYGAQQHAAGWPDDELLAKALFATARVRQLPPPQADIGTAPNTFNALEPAAEIEKHWNVPPDDPWKIHQQSWLAEARTVKAAIRVLSGRTAQGGENHG